jgi:hypothetical protein
MSEIKSNMGLAKVEYPRIIFNRPQYFLLWGGLALLALFAAFVTANIWLALLALPFAIAFVIYTQQLKGLFFDCDVNLAKVLSCENALYAVATNLSGAGETPRIVVKVVKAKVPQVKGFEYSDGAYFPAICYPNYGKKAGEDDVVFTLPLTAGVSDIETLNSQQDYFKGQIDVFERALSLVPTPFKPGLYKLDNQALASL